MNELLFLDNLLLSHNHTLDADLFLLVIKNYPLMKKDIIAEVDNKKFYHLHLDEANWSNSVIVEE